MLASTFGWGQPPVVFDTVHTNAAGSFASGKSVYEVLDGYLVFSHQKGVLGGLQNPFVTKFDLQGGLVWEKEYVHNRYVNYGMCDPVARCADGGFISGISVFGAGEELDSLFVFRFDEEGDTLWTRFLMTDTTVTIRKTIETGNGDFILAGFHTITSSTDTWGAYIFRLDPAGDSIFFKNLGVPRFFAVSVAEDQEGDIYVTGVGQHAAAGHSGDAFLVKLDAQGNVLWRRYWPRLSGYNNILITPSGHVIVVGYVQYDIVEWPGWTEQRALVVKYAPNGTQVWAKEPIQSDGYMRPCGFTDGFVQPDNSIIACGTMRTSETLDKGMIFKFDPDGEVIWSRLYSYYDGPWPGNDQVFNDVEPTSDGGFILTGGVTRFIDSTYTHPEKLWLVKLDSLGCLVPGCQLIDDTGINDIALNLNQYFSIWPNPVMGTGQVEVSFDPPQGFTATGTLRLVLLDALGRKVHDGPWPSHGNTRAAISLQDLSSGIYHIHLTDEHTWLAGGKVVVE